MQQTSSPLLRSTQLLALTSLILLFAMKGSLASWLSDLPQHELTRAAQSALDLVPDLGLSDLYETLRQRFLELTR